jgi:hypothetical protein
MQPESILSKTHDLWKILFPVLSRLPKHYKFTLGDRAQSVVSDLLELVVEAYYSPPAAKKPLLQRTNIKIELLRHYLRLGYELSCYPSTTLVRMAEPLDEIGRMTGGWLKSLEK